MYLATVFPHFSHHSMTVLPIKTGSLVRQEIFPVCKRILFKSRLCKQKSSHQAVLCEVAWEHLPMLIIGVCYDALRPAYFLVFVLSPVMGRAAIDIQIQLAAITHYIFAMTNLHTVVNYCSTKNINSFSNWVPERKFIVRRVWNNERYSVTRSEN